MLRGVWCVVCGLFVGVVVGFACATRSILNSKYLNTLHSLRHLAAGLEDGEISHFWSRYD